MKKKLALLMAAIMTVAMVPMTAFAATDLTVTKNLTVGVGDDYVFDALVELENSNSTVGTSDEFTITLTLSNGKFAEDDDDYIMNYTEYLEEETSVHDGYEYGNGYADDLNVQPTTTDDSGAEVAVDAPYITGIKVLSSTKAEITISQFKAGDVIVIPIKAYAVDEGDVIAKFSSNKTVTFTVSDVIATAYDGDVTIESDGVVTFVEDSSDDIKELEAITITGLYASAITGNSITFKLKGNYEFVLFEVESSGATYLGKENSTTGDIEPLEYIDVISFLNGNGNEVVPDGWASGTYDYYKISATEDEFKINFDADKIDLSQVAEIYLSNIYITPTSSCDPGDVAKLTISSKDFDSVTLEVAKMVEEAVTYSVEDDDLPVIWTGKDYAKDDDSSNTLKVYVEENTGDILNTSRKATFTFPDGIEVVGISYKAKEFESSFKYQIDENVVTIWNYSSGITESSDETDFGMEFLINAAPTYEGDVEVTLGGEFDDVEFTVATVKAPYTVEAKTSEVLIDYRYVPVNEIVITEAEEGILEEGDIIRLQVEKMDFEDAGTYEVTEGDIEVDVDIFDDEDDIATLEIEVTDDSTEASTITISGLELYLDRTLPVGGYALLNVGSWDADTDRANDAINILWENSSTEKDLYDADAVTGTKSSDKTYDAFFKYDEVVCNDSYVEVVTAARDQDDSTTSRKIVITIGATTMSVGTETITLDAPAYINSEDYTMLPVRAISEAFGATVTWDDASKTVTVLSGQRIISMTIGSKTMYINGTPVAMNTAAEITNDRTFIPVRDLANSLGISAIDWNEASATVTLN